jgi:choice-of-anchor B domain-containing protein
VHIFERVDGAWRPAASFSPPADALDSMTGGETFCDGGEAGLFSCERVDMLSFLSVKDIGAEPGIRVNDVWGWTDPEAGREYAIVGRNDGTSFIDVTNAQNPVYLGNLPKTEGSHTSTWRDMKVYDDHVFIVADQAGQHGMQVFDLTRLRDVDDPPVQFDEDARYDGIASAHNIVINEDSGYAYAVGANSGGETCGGGLHMIDIREPLNPTFAGCFSDTATGRSGTGYSHDAMCIDYHGPDDQYQGREICFGSNETALSIADVTDKDDPVKIASAEYPNVGYAHQGWITDDHRYFYSDDELDEIQGMETQTRTLVWDVSDLDDPQLVREYMAPTKSSDHNLYIKGNTMYQSNYVAGLRVLDISDPENPVEIGHFDTTPYGGDEPGFNGSWSNYPFFESGTIIVTSGHEGVFLLKKRDVDI